MEGDHSEQVEHSLPQVSSIKLLGKKKERQPLSRGGGGLDTCKVAMLSFVHCLMFLTILSALLIIIITTYMGVGWCQQDGVVVSRAHRGRSNTPICTWNRSITFIQSLGGWYR